MTYSHLNTVSPPSDTFEEWPLSYQWFSRICQWRLDHISSQYLETGNPEAIAPCLYAVLLQFLLEQTPPTKRRIELLKQLFDLLHPALGWKGKALEVA